MQFLKKVCLDFMTPRFLVPSMIAGVIAVTGFGAPPTGTAADAIYHGGPIITMDDARPSAQAVAIKDGRILAVGAKVDVESAHKGDSTAMIDLKGGTLLPGFVDAHSHFSQVGLLPLSANLLPPPDGGGSSIKQIMDVLRKHIASRPGARLGEKGVVVGINYDDSRLEERRHPTKRDLDKVSKDIPIVVIHQSTHMSVSNTAALKLAGITKASIKANPPTGGTIHTNRWGEPTGLMDEGAHVAMMQKLLQFTDAATIEMMIAAQAVYASQGFTTVQEGRADPKTMGVMANVPANTFQLDVVAYPDLSWLESAKMLDAPLMSGPLMSTPASRKYTNHFRIGGVKLALDGSPQGRTAWFTEKYTEAPAGAKEGYRGAPNYTDAELLRFTELAYDKKWQMIVHANGDAAVDQMLRVVKTAAKTGQGEDRRTVLIHGQYMRADQIPAIKALAIFPSLFPLHTFYWGDWHLVLAGSARAELISPTASVLDAGMWFSIHSDAPVTSPNSMRILDSAVNRVTLKNHVLGPAERIEPIVALKAMTLWPAFQHFEESTKGSIEVGKVADFVILCRNPLRATAPEDRHKLHEIPILETIKDGKSIYRRAGDLPACEPDAPAGIVAVR